MFAAGVAYIQRYMAASASSAVQHPGREAPSKVHLTATVFPGSAPANPASRTTGILAPTRRAQFDRRLREVLLVLLKYSAGCQTVVMRLALFIRRAVEHPRESARASFDDVGLASAPWWEFEH